MVLVIVVLTGLQAGALRRSFILTGLQAGESEKTSSCLVDLNRGFSSSHLNRAHGNRVR